MVDSAFDIQVVDTAVVYCMPTCVDMSGCPDFNLTMPGRREPVADTYHARGINSDQPAGWLVYCIVDDVVASIRACTDRGAKLLVRARGLARGCCRVAECPSVADAALNQSLPG